MGPPPARTSFTPGRRRDSTFSSTSSWGSPSNLAPREERPVSASLREAASTLQASLPPLGALLQSRCTDERPAVRRSALAALEAWSRVSPIPLGGSALAGIKQRCADVSPMIRKQARAAAAALIPPLYLP
jgi:hypothetical protein